MFSIPTYIFLVGALIAWLGLMNTWFKHIQDATELRRIKAIERGETPPDIKGTSNYERAELRENAHRAMQVTTKEQWIGKVITFGVPLICLVVVLLNL